jgi:hypothetical protein
MMKKLLLASVAAAWVIKYGLTRPHYKAADEL